MSVAKLTLSLRESGELNGTKTHSSSSGNVQANGMDLFLDQHDALFDCVEIIFGTERFRIHHTNSSGKTCRRTRAEWLQILPQHQDFLQNLVKDKVVNSGTLYSLTADLPSAKITQQNFSALPSSLPPFSPNPLKSSDGTVPKTAQQSFTSLKEGIERSPAVASSHSQPRAYMPYSGSGVPLPPPTRTPAPSRSKSGDPTRLVQASHNQDANYGDGYGSNACSAIVTEALPEMISGRLRTKDQMDGVMRRGIRNYHHIFKRDYYLNDIQGQEKFKRLAKGRSYDVAKDDLPPPLLPPEETAKLHQTFSRQLEPVRNPNAPAGINVYEEMLTRGQEKLKFEILLKELQERCKENCQVGERVAASMVIDHRTIGITVERLAGDKFAFYLFDSHADEHGNPAFYRRFDSLTGLVEYLADKYEAHTVAPAFSSDRATISRTNARNTVSMVVYKVKSS